MSSTFAFRKRGRWTHPQIGYWIRNDSAALQRTALLDTPTEEAFDRLTRLATKLLHAPVALVSLVDANRQFFKSSVGLPEPTSSARQTPLSHSFCQHTVNSGKPTIIPDAGRHPLVKNNPSIQELGIKAYAGCSLPPRTDMSSAQSSPSTLTRASGLWKSTRPFKI